MHLSLIQQARDPQKMRRFGLVMCTCFAIFIGVAIPLIFRTTFRATPLAIAAVFGILAILRPQLRRLARKPVRLAS